MLVDFCLPAKNESLIIRNNLDKLLAYCRQAEFDFSWRIVGVVNGSNDDSSSIFQEYKERYPEEVDWFEVSEPGKGGALKKYWSLSRADILAFMDIDLAVALDSLPALISPLVENKSDLSIGSRFLPGAKRQRSLAREIVSRTYVLISNLLLRGKVSDYQCGFKALRREVFCELGPLFRDNYWFFDTELIVLAERFGYRISQIPVDWRENRYGKSRSAIRIFRDSFVFLKNLISFRRYLRKLKVYSGNAVKPPTASSGRPR